MTTIAVTGVGGLLGRALVARLREDPHGVTRVLGLDLRVPGDLAIVPAPVPEPAQEPAQEPETGAPVEPLALELHAVDVRDPALVGLLEGVDVVVHLAFQMDPIRDLDLMRSINVDGTMNVLASARAAGVGRVVYLSSVVAYGAHPDNDLPLSEASPLRGQAGFPYAEHKREVEELVWLWHAAGDGPALTVLRSAAVFGPGVQNFLTRILELPVLPRLPDAPPLQFVHVDDVVGAIVHAIAKGIDGAFNVAPDGWLEHDRALALVGRRVVPMDAERMRSLVERAHHLGLGEIEPGVVELFRHPWVLANDRLRATGWVPTRSNEEALLETVAEHEGFVSLGRVRMRRSLLRGIGIASGAALAAATAAVLRRR
jgi:nucleoside-diphosphate-sugar epimerase